MNINWLENSIIFECISGSHAYGLNTPESDTDYRGICIPPEDYFLGMYSFDQHEQKDYYLSKIYKVAIVNNIGVTIVPGCIELYTAESNILILRNDIFTFDPKYDDEQLYEKSLDEIKSEKELDSI